MRNEQNGALQLCSNGNSDNIEIEIEIEIVYNMYRMIAPVYTKYHIRRLLSLSTSNYAIQETFKSWLDR
jgi:hypothetical protein